MAYVKPFTVLHVNNFSKLITQIWTFGIIMYTSGCKGVIYLCVLMKDKLKRNKKAKIDMTIVKNWA